MSLALSFAQKYTGLLLTVPTIMIVSRLLTPAQIGVYSVGAAFLALVHALRDFGVSDYLIQEHSLDDARARSAFTINLCVAWLLGAALFASSPWIAEFYGEPGLGKVLQVLSINFVLLPFGSTVNALLQRSMQFSILYKIKLGQQVIQSGMSVTLAAMGFGYMSLAWASVGGMVATVLGCMVWASDYRIRGMGLSHWRDVGRFGVASTSTTIVTRLGLHAPEFIIGRVLGFAAAGFYSRGYGLINMFRLNVIGAIGAVAFPTFAQRQRESNSAHEIFLKSLTYITGISWPFFALSALLAFPIMRIMFGPQWDEAVPILRWLSLAAFVGALSAQCGQFFTAIGRVGLVVRIVTVANLFRIFVLIPAAFHSLNAVAAVQILPAFLVVFLNYQALFRHTELSMRDMIDALRPSLMVTFCAMLAPLLVYWLMTPSENSLWVPFLLSGLGAAIGWSVGIYLFDHPLKSELSDITARIHRRVLNPRA